MSYGDPSAGGSVGRATVGRASVPAPGVGSAGVGGRASVPVSGGPSERTTGRATVGAASVPGSGAAPAGRYTYDFGPFTIEGAPGMQQHPAAYCPRRTVLDKLLIDAAADAGAEVGELRRARPDRGRACRRHPGAFQGRPVDQRTGRDRHRRRRAQLGRCGSSARRTLQRKADTACTLLRLLERIADAMPLRIVHPRQARLCSRPNP